MCMHACVPVCESSSGRERWRLNERQTDRLDQRLREADRQRQDKAEK